MKKKITSLITVILMCLTAVPMLADELSLTGYGDVVTAPQADKLYVIQGNAQHDNIISWLYDNNGALAATEGSEIPTGIENMKYVWTFEISDNGYAAKNYMTGRYICIEGTSNGGNVKMQDSPAYFTIEINGDEVGFKNASGQYIDMSYSGIKPVTWSGGVAGSRRLTIYTATVEEVADLTAALARLNSCYSKYEDYVPNFGNLTIDRGTEIGQYNCSDEDYDLFITNLQLAHDILFEEVDIEDFTVEAIDAIIQNIEEGYAAIMASLVTLTIADGNYRIVSALEWTNTARINTGELDENGQPIYQETTIHPTKAMYATLEGKAMWANIDSTDCRYLWKLTNNAETGLLQMMNIATDGILNDCSQSTQATLTTNSQTEMKFEFIERRNEKIVVAMKPSQRGNYGFLHCNNHGGGSGTGSNIVGWEAGAGASQWILEPVSDEEVAKLVNAYAPIKDHELLVSMFQDLISETEAAIAQAQDISYITERSTGLITDTLQFSSPWTEPTEGSFGNVLNDNADTFWHSNWSNGNVSNHTHYFQVTFNEPIGGIIQSFMRRRNAANDHITKLGVFGSNNANALENTSEDGWNELGTYDLSQNASASLTVYSNGLDYGEGYQYLRFYIDGTTTGRGYGHFATFQLYRLTYDGNTQWSQMGDVATAVEAALNTAKEVDLDEVEMEDYNALKDALDAFKALLVDPTALATAIEANKDIINLVAIGDNPGFWSPNSDVSTLTTTLQEATAYLKGGAYTQAQIDAYVEAITSGVSDLMALANPVDPGKWYALKFDSEENYEAHQWSKTPAINNDLGDLYNNYAAPANVEEGALVGFESLEEVIYGQAVRFINEEEIPEMDQVAFRFVAQGDTAYVIQHKSGLYLGGASRSTNLTLGFTPALFNVRAVGYGKVVIEARNLKGQGYYTEPVYLHAQNAGHSLVTWNNDVVSSNSALYIEPIDERDFDEGEEVAESALMNAKPNSIIFMCYPTAFSVTDAEIYAYQGAISETDSTAHYTFNKIEQAEAGQPVLLVVGDREYFDADDEEEEPEQIGITPLGTSFAINPMTSGGAHGTYAYEWVNEGTVVVGGGAIGKAGNTLVLAEGKENTNCTRDISANTGYIVYGENVLKNASVDDFDLVITAGKPIARGDVNCDGMVDIADAVSVLNAMAGQQVQGVADVNGDGEVDIADLVTVLNIMAGQ